MLRKPDKEDIIQPTTVYHCDRCHDTLTYPRPSRCYGSQIRKTSSNLQQSTLVIAVMIHWLTLARPDVTEARQGRHHPTYNSLPLWSPPWYTDLPSPIQMLRKPDKEDIIVATTIYPCDRRHAQWEKRQETYLSESGASCGSWQTSDSSHLPPKTVQSNLHQFHPYQSENK